MRALIIAGRHTTHDEFVYPLRRLEEDGWHVDVAVRGNQMVLSDLGGKIQPTMDIPDNPTEFNIFPGTKFEKWNLLILPGGAKAMEYMRQDAFILTAISWLHSKGCTIGCICHGAQLLISAGLVRGRKISGYYSIKDDINNAGGTYVDAPFVTDGRIVTSPHYKHLGPWMAEVLRMANLPSSLLLVPVTFDAS